MPKMKLPLIAQELDFTCGATCFESMMRFFKKESRGEIYYAEKLQSFDLGFTPPENIAKLARDHGFESGLKEGATVQELRDLFSPAQVLFVTWWDEDAGHYSLLEDFGEDCVVLMDPWFGRTGGFHHLPLSYFLDCWKLRGSKVIWVKEPLCLSSLFQL